MVFYVVFFDRVFSHFIILAFALVMFRAGFILFFLILLSYLIKSCLPVDLIIFILSILVIVPYRVYLLSQVHFFHVVSILSLLSILSIMFECPVYLIYRVWFDLILCHLLIGFFVVSSSLYRPYNHHNKEQHKKLTAQFPFLWGKPPAKQDLHLMATRTVHGYIQTCGNRAGVPAYLFFDPNN